ncbi:hypothetical protein ACS0TY_012640 [Phlomoides rotata]
MEKEKRRKKIISRGEDRMALITGRLNALDPDPISKCSSFTVARNDYNPPPQHVRSSSEPLAGNQQVSYQYDLPHGGRDATDTLTKPDHIEEVSKRNDSTTRVSNHQKLEQKQTATVSSDSAYSHEKQCNSFIGNYDSVTAKEINFSIISTEDTRVICSIALGILVVLYHVTFSRNIVKPKSLIAYTPLYVVLLTDVLVVAARLAPYTHMRKEEKECKIEEDELNLAGALRYLELGLVVHQTIRGFFIDCCFYLAVVVIGLSLLS